MDRTALRLRRELGNVAVGQLAIAAEDEPVPMDPPIEAPPEMPINASAIISPPASSPAFCQFCQTRTGRSVRKKCCKGPSPLRVSNNPGRFFRNASKISSACELTRMKKFALQLSGANGAPAFCTD